MGRSGQCGTGTMDDGRYGYVVAGAFLPFRLLNGPTMQKLRKVTNKELVVGEP